jgi:hypothetical protein
MVAVGFAAKELIQWHKEGRPAHIFNPPTVKDYPLILRGTKGAIIDLTLSELYARACDQGWPETCGRAGAANGQ